MFSVARAFNCLTRKQQEVPMRQINFSIWTFYADSGCLRKISFSSVFSYDLG